MSEYGRVWQALWEVRAKIDALTAPRGIASRNHGGFPETFENARERVQKRKDELDQLLAEWTEIERRMERTPE